MSTSRQYFWCRYCIGSVLPPTARYLRIYIDRQVHPPLRNRSFGLRACWDRQSTPRTASSHKGTHRLARETLLLKLQNLNAADIYLSPPTTTKNCFATRQGGKFPRHIPQSRDTRDEARAEETQRDTHEGQRSMDTGYTLATTFTDQSAKTHPRARKSMLLRSVPPPCLPDTHHVRSYRTVPPPLPLLWYTNETEWLEHPAHDATGFPSFFPSVCLSPHTWGIQRGRQRKTHPCTDGPINAPA